MARPERPQRRRHHQSNRRYLATGIDRRRDPARGPRASQSNLCAGTRLPRRSPGRLVRRDVYRSAKRLTGLQPVRRDAPPQRRDARRRRRAALRYSRRRFACVHVYFDDGLRDAERETVRQGVLGAGPAEPDRRNDRRRAGHGGRVRIVHRPLPDRDAPRHDRRRTRRACSTNDSASAQTFTS